MTDSQRVQWQEVQQVLGGQHLAPVWVNQYVVSIGDLHGGVVNIAPRGQQAGDRVRPRPQPPRILPPTVAGFLDRESEQGQVGAALARRQAVDLHGPDGMGKTALIGQVMQTQLPGAYDQGTVYLSAGHETREDLLQELFESFYETDGTVKATENLLRRYMVGKRALIAVDDANHLAEGEAEDLIRAVPQCAVLIAGRKPQVWSGVSVALARLPEQQALALFEQRYGRLTAEDQPVVKAICGALGNMPLAIVKTATVAAQQRLPLAQVLLQVQPPAGQRDPVGQAFQVVAGRLSAEERRVLGGLAAPGGRTVEQEALPAITGLTPEQVSQALAHLQQMGLVYANSPRYSLDDAFRPYIRGAFAGEGMRARAADHYLQQAPRLRGRPRDPDERNVMAALDYYYQQRRWGEVVWIARAVDRYLATTGRWGQWRQRLEQARQAARELGDRAAEAWAQNQLGVIALGAGNMAAAAGFFQAALALWQALGDRAGMTIARWNLQILAAVPPTPPRKAKPGKAAAGGGGLTLPIVLAAVLAVILVIGVLVIPWGPPTATVTPSHTPRTPTITPSHTPRTPTITPTATVTPSHTPTTPVPRSLVQIELGKGCGLSYPPCQGFAVRLQANRSGLVEVYRVSPAGEREFLFDVGVTAGEITTRDWKIPRSAGDWVLEADLNGGQARSRCAFRVEPESVRPAIEKVWIEPFVPDVGPTPEPGQPVCPGSKVWVYTHLFDPCGEPLSRVELWARYPAGGTGDWLPVEMFPVDPWTYRHPMTAHEPPGTEYYVYAEDGYGNPARSAVQVYFVEPCPVVLYDFVERAPQARWTGYAPPYSFYGLKFPGADNDQRGFAVWRDGATLEDGSRPDHRILETHPAWVDGGAIWGEYEVPFLFQSGDRFVARVGFLAGAGAGNVTFQLVWWNDDPDSYRELLGSLADSYDGVVRNWVVPLDSIAGQTGYMRLVVEAGETSAQDWAVWVEARIERP